MVEILFDAYERKLLAQIAAFSITQQGREVFSYNAFTSHPEGVLELAVAKEIRIAKALYFILNTDSDKDTSHRLKALERLRGDIFSVKTGLRINAARVLVEIMKDLLGQSKRSNLIRQLELLRDFREVFSGKAGIVRRQLQRYQLLEIPEDESQLAFDDTVYNVSKLKKMNPSHLILDAWVKGVRKLQVVYTNYLKSDVVRELISAVAILGMEIDIGIEFPVFYNNKIIRLVWSPIGFYTVNSYLRFLSSDSAKQIIDLGCRASLLQQGRIFSYLRLFNLQVREKIINEFGISLAKLQESDYKAFLGGDDPSELNLSEYIYNEISLQNVGYCSESSTGRKKEFLKHTIYKLTPEFILLNYLSAFRVSGQDNVSSESGEILDSVKKFVKILNNAGCAYNLTLLTGNIEPWEVPEILYRSKGCITAVEIFNLRDYTFARSCTDNYTHAQINSFRKALNSDNVVKIKKKLTQYIVDVKESNADECERILQGLEKVRRNIVKLLMRYEGKHIEAVIGSGAAGRGMFFYGMGFAVEQSLPRSARKLLKKNSAAEHLALPLGCQVYRQIVYRSGGRGVRTFWQRFVLWKNRKHVWQRQKLKEVEGALEGNIFTLSGKCSERKEKKSVGRWSYLYHYGSTDAQNMIKFLIGFIPAFITFYLTADWWVLKYGGGIIWFAITGGRNFLQAMLSAGALNKSTLTNWRSFVDKKRIAESLMFTGLSVPLLEYLVKNLLLGRAMGVDAGGDPLTVYAVMSLINGIYIAGHNLYRGFPMLAVVGNLFRSGLAIPVSLLINFIFEESLLLAGIAGVGVILTNWSAVISKTASDVVACLIEGVADKGRYIAFSERGMNELEQKFLSLCERIELIFPQKSACGVFRDADLFKIEFARKYHRLNSELILWLLDLLYFWNYKPRAQEVISRHLLGLNEPEKETWLAALQLLDNSVEVGRVISDLDDEAQKVVNRFYQKNSSEFVILLRDLLGET